MREKKKTVHCAKKAGPFWKIENLSQNAERGKKGVLVLNRGRAPENRSFWGDLPRRRTGEKTLRA